MNHLQVAHVALVKSELDEGAFFLPPLVSRCPGIDMEQVKFPVIDYLEDMAVAIDKSLTPSSFSSFFIPGL